MKNKDDKKTEKNYAKIDTNILNWKTILWQIISTYILVYPFIRMFYTVEINGRKNIPKHRVICAPNHISYFDPHMTYIAIRRPMTFMAKKELFETKLKDAILSLGAFAVNREKLEIATIRSVKEIMKTKNWHLCIFPQGGINKDKKIQNIKSGFVAIAKMAKNDILPISITGTEVLNWKPLKKGHITVNIGTPISWELDEQDIINQWCEQVSSMAGYENLNSNQQTVEV
jgi:1-acyl-sn-glycerol-3-phosphate acyltransferase